MAVFLEAYVYVLFHRLDFVLVTAYVLDLSGCPLTPDN